MVSHHELTNRPHGASQWGWSAFAALGIVYGDLGTSPLYTMQTVVQAVGGHITPASALGILSAIFWTLIITVSTKYCLLVMRADNHGEGGILALMSMIGANGFSGGVALLTGLGLLGAALIYGDGAITPAISVLSALEGINVLTGDLKPYIMPAAVVILLTLFAAQRYGTERIARAFSPIMLLWFVVIGLLGIRSVAKYPAVLTAVDPRFAINFLRHTSFSVGVLVLGGIFLCITGGEALYADMGHFGRGPIRRAWYIVVLPALLLSYAGQTAFMLKAGKVDGNPFFLMAPAWSIIPLVALATVATIIASQAIITGSFSMTRQAMQLGWLPGLSIRQTSDRIYGQIYVPVVNWLLMIATIGITIAFASSDRLAGAYGTAVATTMLLTTVLLYRAMRVKWKWALPMTLSVISVFLIVDSSFFIANLFKIAEGGWLPLTLAAVLFVVMSTWRLGVTGIRERLMQDPEAGGKFLAELEAGTLPRVPGTMIFLTRSTQRVSRLIIDHAHFVGTLPRFAVALNINFEEVPRIEGPRCTLVEQIGEGIWRVVARFGFMEIPDLTQALRQAQGLDPAIDIVHAHFVAARDLVVSKPVRPALSGWRMALFAFLYRNAAKVVDRFNLAPTQVVEIARQIDI